MTETIATKESLLRRAYVLRRWGLVSIIAGFLALLYELIGPDIAPWIYIPVALLIAFARPTYEWHASRLRKLAAVIILIFLLTVVEVGLSRLGQITGLRPPMVYAVAFLGLGIILQLVAEHNAFRSSFVVGPLDPLIERIRRL